MAAGVQQGSTNPLVTTDGSGGHRPEYIPTDASGNVLGGSGTSAEQVQGNVAHDGVDSGNPIKLGAYAKASAPANVSADADRVNLWALLNGALAIYNAYGLNITDDALVDYEDAIIVRPTITTTAVAYTAGDVVGGILTLTSAVAAAAPVELRSLVLKDDLNQKPALQILFFRSSPAGTYTDNAAVVVSTADMGNLVGMLVVATGDWVTINGTTKAVASYEFDEGMLMGPAASAIFMVIVAVGTPTYGADATSLTAEVGFVRKT